MWLLWILGVAAGLFVLAFGGLSAVIVLRKKY